MPSRFNDLPGGVKSQTVRICLLQLLLRPRELRRFGACSSTARGDFGGRGCVPDAGPCLWRAYCNKAHSHDLTGGLHGARLVKWRGLEFLIYKDGSSAFRPHSRDFFLHGM